MTVNELAYLTMADASALLQKRAVSAEDLARHYLGAIERLDPLLNAFLSVEPEDVLAQARRADAERAAGAGRGRLHGIPYALKDLIDVQGRITTCHSKIRAHHRAPQDATIVRRLADEGMVLLGKTALHEFATGGPCRDLPWPPALNPWDRLRHPGGSSSGSAVAVAMDMAPASIGTDTGGSVRNPATCCGLVGMKPTYGVVSRFGVFPLAPSLDHVGPLTRTVEDNAMLLQAMVGTDPADPTSVRHPDCDFLKGIHLPLAGLRIGLVENFHEKQFHPAPEMVAALQAAARRIEALGARVDSTNLAPLQEWRECGVGIQQYEQYRIHAQWLRERAQDYCQASRQKLAAGAHIDAAMYARLQARRLQLVASLQETFRHFDFQPRPALPYRRPGRGGAHLQPPGTHALQRGRQSGPGGAHGLLGVRAAAGHADRGAALRRGPALSDRRPLPGRCRVVRKAPTAARQRTGGSMTASLIRGKYVVCRAAGNGLQVIENGGVLHQGGTIAAIGDADELIREHRPATVHGSPAHLVLPGFVNAHHHGGLLAFQMGTLDGPLELWSADRLRRRDVDAYLDTLYGAFEMVESGVTTVQHLHSRASGPVESVHGTAHRIIQAYRDIGMRVSYSFGLRDQNRFVYQSDEAFLGRLPAELRQRAADTVLSKTLSVNDTLDLFRTLHREHAHSGDVAIQLSASNLQWCSDTALLALQDTAAAHGVPVHMHLLETRAQKEYARRRTGGTAVSHLQALGMLGPRLTLGHGVWLTQRDLEILAETGTHLCHCPSSNLRLRSGIAPIACALHAGVSVAMGLDDASLNDDRCMLQEMRLALRLHQQPGAGVPAPSAAQVFSMATERAAQTTPFAARIGVLEVGRAADVVLMDWNRITYPYLDADIPLAEAIVQRARADGVESVFVGGVPILHERRFSRLDKQAAVEELAASLRIPLQAGEARRKQLAQDLAPHIRAFYESEGYAGLRGATPYYEINSRV
jgi:5-methylthioadenosine/S-adenosylhomocysteine deaminase